MGPRSPQGQLSLGTGGRNYRSSYQLRFMAILDMFNDTPPLA